ncbi:MAG: hypothetical protein ACR2LG_09700 [Actinomycetota bacterium]
MTAASIGPLDLVALEAVRSVAAEYGIPTGQVKPCVAYLLDGNQPAAPQHEVAFTIAIELRRLDWSEDKVGEALAHWAKKIGYPISDTRRALKSAFTKKPNGEHRYHPPGLHKKTGSVYSRTLKPACDEVGCPANCPAMASRFSGQVEETFEKFTQLGWPAYLKKNRWRSAIDVYEAICRREKQLKFAPGVELFTTYEQLAELAGVNKTTVGDALRRLTELSLITFQAGSGSGPHSRDRVASKVRRVIPIPSPPGSPIRAIREGGERQPHIGGRSLRTKAPSRYYQSWGGLTSREPDAPSPEHSQ